MHKFTFVLTALLLSASMSMAQLKVPARQISVYTNTLGTIGQVTNAQSPEDTIQAYIEWMDDNWGYASQDLEATLLDGQNAGGNSATNLGTVQAVTGLFDVVDIGDATINGSLTIDSSIITTNNDMALSFMGFPKLTLTTNMFASVSNGGTPIPIESFSNALDSSTATYTTNGIINSDADHSYVVDLGASYQGWIVVKGTTTNLASAAFGQKLGACDTYPVNASGIFKQYNIYTEMEFSTASTATNTYTQAPLNGRFVVLENQGASGSSATYRYSDIAVYGVTNGWRNEGGW